jgi:zinc protease
VGRADERATTTGLTHLVEHLALPARSRRRIDFNGSVDNILTTFWASGDEDRARTFLEETARSVASLPLERLETERQILLAEEAAQGPNLTRIAFALRYGPVTHGLTGYDEWGLRRVTAEDVAAWSAERFTSANAALWLTGPEPGSLDLALPAGTRHLPPDAHAIPEVVAAVPSLYRSGPSGAVAFSLESQRTTAFRIGLNILGHRVQDRLRYERALSYELEVVFVPLTADRVHVVLVTDATDQNVPAVTEEMLRTLGELADDGPTEEELAEELDDARRYAADPTERHSELFYVTAQSLFGAPYVGRRAQLEEQERLTAGEVAEAIDQARRTLIAIVPDVPLELPGLGGFPICAESSVDGRKFRPRGLRLRRGADPRLVVGDAGLTIEAGDMRSTVRYADCVAALRFPDGSRSILGADGFFVVIDPSLWKDGAEAVAAVDAAIPQELAVRMEPALTEQTESVEDTAAEKLTRRWAVSEELGELPGRLEPGEQIVTLAEAAKGMRTGLLVVTDRRVIFHARIWRDTWLEFPLDTIDSVEGKPGLMDSTVTIGCGAETVTFSGVTPKERAEEIANEIASRRG